MKFKDYISKVLNEGDVFPYGTKVLLDKKDKAIVRQAFPVGSASYSFPHYKVDIIGGDKNVAIAMNKVTEDKTGKSINETKKSLNDSDLDDTAFDHIAEKIKEGYTEGELNYEDDNKKSYSGWWTIKIEKDDNDEDERLAEVSKHVNNGIKHGYYPTFTLKTEWWEN